MILSSSFQGERSKTKTRALQDGPLVLTVRIKNDLWASVQYFRNFKSEQVGLFTYLRNHHHI